MFANGLTCVSVEVPELCSRFTMKPNDLQYIAVIISRDSPPTRDNVGTYGEFLIASYWQLSRNFEKRPSAAACLCWDSLRRVIFMYRIQGTRKYHNQPKFPTKSTSVAHVFKIFWDQSLCATFFVTPSSLHFEQHAAETTFRHGDRHHIAQNSPFGARLPSPNVGFIPHTWHFCREKLNPHNMNHTQSSCGHGIHDAKMGHPNISMVGFPRQ